MHLYRKKSLTELLTEMHPRSINVTLKLTPKIKPVL